MCKASWSGTTRENFSGALRSAEGGELVASRTSSSAPLLHRWIEHPISIPSRAIHPGYLSPETKLIIKQNYRLSISNSSLALSLVELLYPSVGFGVSKLQMRSRDSSHLTTIASTPTLTNPRWQWPGEPTQPESPFLLLFVSRYDLLHRSKG
ncbi:hypothetical protein VTI74DRAFT_3795 [Chaetomium olivicolor]